MCSKVIDKHKKRQQSNFYIRSLSHKTCGAYRSRTDDLYAASVAL